MKYKKSYFLRSTNELLIYVIWYLDIDFKRTVTCFLRMCGVLISGLVNLFSRFAFGEKSSSVDPEMPEKAIISVFKSYLVYLEVLNAIFCIFVQALLRKLEVIQKNCTKAYYLLSVFLQTDQTWCLMWSYGFHFCLLSSPLNDLPFSVRF